MPWIPKEDRPKLDEFIAPLMGTIEHQGDLAYTIYRLVLPHRSYRTMSGARAVLRDLYDIITEELLLYEAQKKKDNGPIL
jgi:hypothetical protein